MVDTPPDTPEIDDTTQRQSKDIDLTPIRAHYLKKTLIQLQFHSELDAITTASPGNASTLSYLGPPFKPPPKDAPHVDMPFMRFMFRQFVLTFPFMAAAPQDFYSDKLQPFIASILSRNISPTSPFDTDPDYEKHTRLKLLAKLERNLSMFLGFATKLVEPEQVVRLAQSDLDRLEAISKARQGRTAKERDVFEVNIVSVRTVVDKHRLRSRAHEEFIIRTRRSHCPDVYVSRRYGDFRTLADELRKYHPAEEIRPPPPKDRTTISAPTGTSPLSPTPSFSSSHSDLMGNGTPTSASFFTGSMPSRLAREKNRLTLRAYLHSLLSTSAVASSPVLRSFLTSSPTSLSPDEEEDASRREEADRVRDDGRKRFAQEIANRVDGLREAVRSAKGDLLGKDGLTNIFARVKQTPDIRDLPDNYHAVIEWARMSLASTVFHHFVASDSAAETFAGLKRIHGLMPYFMFKTVLKISNPVAMIRGVLDLFLAQPFGGRSLLQRMFSGSLAEEARHLEEEIAAVKEKVDDDVICEKIRQFVYAPREIQDMYKLDAAEEKMSLLTIVLRSGETPVLARAQMHRVAKAHRAHALYTKSREGHDSDDDDGPQDEDAWLYEDLKVLAFLFSRLRDREQILDLIFEGNTSVLLKDILTIFYTPLAQVYRAASIADTLGDIQNFINDLIKTVEQTEQANEENTLVTVQKFVDLVQRHEQSFYHFVHNVHTKGEGLFTGLMQWVELFLTFIREGLSQPVSLEYILPHTGQARADILGEVDQVARYHYRLKLAYEEKLRRRFAAKSRHHQNDADAKDDETQALVHGVVGELSFDDLIGDTAEEVAVEDSEDGSSDESSSEYESASEGDSDSETDSGSGSDDNSHTDESIDRTPRTPNKAPEFIAQAARKETSSQDKAGSRKRAHSLRSSRSLHFLQKNLSKLSLHSRTRSQDHKSEAVPPVPPLPPPKDNIASSSRPSPMPSTNDQNATIRAQKRPEGLSTPESTSTRSSIIVPSSAPASTSKHSQARPTPRKTKLRPQDKNVKPPDLEHIPQLLPIFAEIMRPLLRPRKLESQVK